MPRSSRPDAGTVLIAAVSGRALAQAVRHAGLRSLVADFFNDADTQALAEGSLKLPGGLAAGFQFEALEAALAELTERASSPPIGLIYGSGFEDRPQLLDRLSGRWSLFGNDTSSIERVKAPESFFAMLAKLRIPCPATVFARDAAGRDWLAKRRGGAGGSHVVPISAVSGDDGGIYYQEPVPGRSVSALFVANGLGATILGFSEQWTAPTPRKPFRYGGAVQPAEIAPALAATLQDAVQHVAAAFALKGLGSADFLVDGSRFVLLEINPRPGATLDIFDTAERPLLRLHLDACLHGRLPQAASEENGPAASAVVYAARAVTIPHIEWPTWSADRPHSCERIDKSRPICTVSARAETADAARALVMQRLQTILDMLS